MVACALEEKSWHDIAGTTSTAAPNTGGFLLNAEKTFVADGQHADAWLVLTRTSGEPGETAGLSLFALLADEIPDGSCQSLETIDSRNYAQLSLQNLQVGAESLIGAAGTAMNLVEPALTLGRAYLASELLGICQECFDRTVAYLKERQQFGVRIGSFQALQHRAAKMFAELESLRSVVVGAALALQDADVSAPALSAAAKARAGLVAHQITNEAMQMHGGMGVTDELDFGLFTKRARAIEATAGRQRVLHATLRRFERLLIATLQSAEPGLEKIGLI